MIFRVPLKNSGGFGAKGRQITCIGLLSGDQGNSNSDSDGWRRTPAPLKPRGRGSVFNLRPSGRASSKTAERQSFALLELLVRNGTRVR
jgi:hypothetical protein